MALPTQRIPLLPWPLALAAVLGLAAGVQAHPGGLNAEGCHNNRKTGDYHCHRSPAPPRPTANSQASPLMGEPAKQGAGTTARTRAFRNCDEARAAGAAPVRRGDPGYGPHLDRDNDGVGCEPRR